MKNKPIQGTVLAIAAAGMFGLTGTAIAEDHAVAKEDLVKCYGVNVCKGHNDCATAKNDCAGHASCKGSGFVLVPSKACADVGGSEQGS